MGSVYFADFTLFNSVCGLTNLVSIEDADDDRTQKRFKLNVPLGSVELRFGHSNVELPKLHWDSIRTICWLDYDDPLTSAALIDIRLLARRISPGSLLAVTVDARLLNDDLTRADETLLDKLIAQIGSEKKIPTLISEAKILKRSDIKQVFRTIMTQELIDGINERNAGMPSEQRITFEQIFNFEYSDKAPMLTLGWVLFDTGQRPQFDACDFKNLKFVRSGAEPFVISPPFLTPHEMRELNRCDAKDTYRTSDLPLPEEERKNYEDIRRYWPTGGYAEMT